jgi:hypothetical protein
MNKIIPNSEYITNSARNFNYLAQNKCYLSQRNHFSDVLLYKYILMNIIDIVRDNKTKIQHFDIDLKNTIINEISDKYYKKQQQLDANNTIVEYSLLK